MHLVFLNQYYPPDAAPTGVMLEAVVEELIAQGHEVTVICAEGGYAGGRQKTARRKTQEEERGGELSVVGCRLSAQEEERGGELSVVGCRLSEEEGKEEEAVGRDGFCLRPCGLRFADGQSRYERPGHSHPPHLSPSARDENGATAEREDPAVAGPALRDEVGRLRKGDPTMVRIGATRFGRGTFVGKLMDYLSYYLGVAWRLAWMVPRPDRVVALTTPPYLSLLARGISRLRGADHAHWVMDVYPDVMVAHGMLREDSLRHRLLAALARWGWGGDRCAAVVTLGPDMAERIGKPVGRDLCIAPTCPQRGDTADEKRDPAITGPASRDEVGRLRQGGPTGDEGRVRRSDPVWVPLWGGPEDGGAASPEAVLALRRQRGWQDHEMIVMYSGNMGLGHRFGEILEVVGRDGFCLRPCGLRFADGQSRYERPGHSHPPHLSPTARDEKESAQDEDGPPDGGRATPDEVGRLRQGDPARFVFFGGGKRRGEIAEFIAAHPECVVELHEYVPREQLAAHLQTADLHLVSLDPSWTGTMLPSKLQGIFAAARPVVFIGDERSSLAQWIRESGGGWVVDPGDVEGLRAAIDEASSPRVRTPRGRAAQAYAMKHFDRKTNARQVAEYLTRYT